MNGISIYRTRSFTRWMNRAGLNDSALGAAVIEMIQGLIDADLGGHIVKKRIALPGRGKRSGARVLVATKLANRWVYLFGFGKNERSNINRQELEMIQKLAQDLLNLSEQDLGNAIAAREIIEVIYDSSQAPQPHS